MEELKLRAKMKKKKPKFVRQEAIVRKRLGTKWRRPKGIHSKMRENRAGKRARVKAGYRLPRKTRGLHKSGLTEVHISNLSQLENLNKEKQVSVFSSTIGKKKKIVMLKKAIELSIQIANIKNPQKTLKKIEDEIKKRKQAKKEKEEKKKPKKKPAPKKEKPKPKTQSESADSAVPTSVGKPKPKTQPKKSKKKPAKKTPTAAELAEKKKTKKEKSQSEAKSSAAPTSKGGLE
ncbi:50S ribosomal protein L32e [Candidatus Woesearchaeota archaeon]|nr:50S ribosomal protein L32e [Candidatus Woesearchaeota archaeon]